MFKLFSQRQSAQVSQPYIYNSLPKEFRMQVVHILCEVVGENPEPWNEFRGNILHSYNPNDRAPSGQFWERSFRTLSKEFGVQTLVDPHTNDSAFLQCVNFLLAADTRKCLDAIDLIFQRIDTEIREYPLRFSKSTPDEAITELNQRFKQHNLGFSFGHELIQLSSELVHQEAVLPALRLLRDHNFEGAEQEFMEAHRHFKNGLHKDAIVSANKAFESTLKTICDRKKWKYDKTATAKPLVTLVLKNGLVPNYLEGYVHSLQSLLDSGAPVIRNKVAGHGQGEKIVDVSANLASYVLNMTASSIVFLIDSYNRVK